MKIAFQLKCKNQYKYSIEFISKKKNKWYFQIYDKDFFNHDLIGKDVCSLGEKCVLGSAKIYTAN